MYFSVKAHTFLLESKTSTVWFPSAARRSSRAPHRRQLLQRTGEIPATKPPRLLCEQCQTNARFCLQLCRCDGGGKEAGWCRKQVSGLGRCGFCCCCVPGRMQHVVSTVTTRRAFHETRSSQTWSYPQKYCDFSPICLSGLPSMGTLQMSVGRPCSCVGSLCWNLPGLFVAFSSF